MSRCTGHCCRNIVLPISPGEIAMSAAAVRDGAEFQGDSDVTLYQDVEQIAGMLRFDRVLRAGDIDKQSGKPMRSDHGVGGTVWVYQCANLTPEGNCGVYEDRPRMCREYPRYCDGGRCDVIGCELADRRLPVEKIVADDELLGALAESE